MRDGGVALSSFTPASDGSTHHHVSASGCVFKKVAMKLTNHFKSCITSRSLCSLGSLGNVVSTWGGYIKIGDLVLKAAKGGGWGIPTY